MILQSRYVKNYSSKKRKKETLKIRGEKFSFIPDSRTFVEARRRKVLLQVLLTRKRAHPLGILVVIGVKVKVL